MSSYTKKKIISIVAPVLAGLKVYKLFESNYSGLGHILTFHRVLPPSKEHRIHNHLSLEISPKQLEETIRFYKKAGYDFVSLDQLYDRMQRGASTNKFVAFTFDDGYKDNFTIAYPILKKHAIPFTIYVTTNFPDQRVVLWWYLLEDMVKEKSRIEFTWKGVEHSIACTTQTEKEAAFDEVRTVINQSFKVEDYKTLLKGIFNKGEGELYGYAKDFVLSWEEIKTLSEDPLCTIGAHTVNHYPLKQLEESKLLYEINESKIRIEDQIDQAVEHFAYPFGKETEASLREFDAVKSLGFKTATTTRIGNIFPDHTDKMECLPRISVNRVTNEDVLHLQASGLLPLIIHRGKKVITN